MVIVIISLVLISCWDARNIDDLYLVFGIGIDMVEGSEDQYLVTLVSPTIDPEAGSGKIELSSVSSSLRNAQDNIQNKSSKRITFNNTKMFILGEEVAKKGIRRHIDTLVRDPESRGTIRLIVTEGRANGLMKVEPDFAPLVSLYLFDLILNSYFTTTVPFTTVREFYNDLLTCGIEPIMPYLKEGNTEQERLANSTAIFKEDKMIGTLTHDESVGLTILKDNVRDGFLTASIPNKKNEYATLRKLSGNSKIKTQVKNGKLVINHNITISGSLTELTTTDILDEDFIRTLESSFAYQTKLICDKVVNKLQNELEVDSIGYGKYVRAYQPNFFDSANWNKQFKEAEINLTVKINIISIGTIE